MTRKEAEQIIGELHAAFSATKIPADRLKVYADAIERMPAVQTFRAIREVAYSEERFPSVGKLMHLIRESEASQRGEQAPTYTGRATLKVSDSCIHCSRRITDQEFEDSNWAFVENGQGEIVGREHRRCYGEREKSDNVTQLHRPVSESAPEQPEEAQIAADIPW